MMAAMKCLEELISGDLDEIAEYKRITDTCETTCRYFIDNQMTIRQVAAETRLSKSLVHNYVHSYIKTYYDEEYCQIKRLLAYNRRYRSKSRKYWRGRCW